MIGKIFGAVVGSKVAQHVRGVEGPTGAAIGALVPMVLRRISLPAMVALGVGGYFAKKVMDRNAPPPKTSRRTTPKS